MHCLILWFWVFVNEIWAKIGYNSAYMWDISEIFASSRGCSGYGYLMMSAKFFQGRPWLPWQRNLGQNWLLLRLYERYLRDPCVYQGVFWVGLLNDVSQILPRPSVVAMATKFELKLVISRLILSPRSGRLSVCNKCARSALDWSQSKVFLVSFLFLVRSLCTIFVLNK